MVFDHPHAVRRTARRVGKLTRVLAATGAVLVGFQAGQNDRVEVLDAYGSETTLTLHRHSVDDVAQSLNASGFDVRARIWREAELAHETTPQAFLLARRR